jgi:hypothetical protein
MSLHNKNKLMRIKLYTYYKTIRKCFTPIRKPDKMKRTGKSADKAGPSGKIEKAPSGAFS